MLVPGNEKKVSYVMAPLKTYPHHHTGGQERCLPSHIRNINKEGYSVPVLFFTTVFGLLVKGMTGIKPGKEKKESSFTDKVII